MIFSFKLSDMKKDWVSNAETRLQLAWRKSTWQRYKGHFHAFATFCFTHDWDPLKPPCDAILAYTEWLIERKLTYNTVNNHLSGIKTFLLWHGHPVTAWEHPKIGWNRRSARMVLRYRKHEQSTVTFRHFVTCLFFTEDLESAPVHLAFILCFIGLLRISNVTIPCVDDFDVTRHTQVRDITDMGDAIRIVLKWSKTNQYEREVLLLPAASSRILCPVLA